MPHKLCKHTYILEDEQTHILSWYATRYNKGYSDATTAITVKPVTVVNDDCDEEPKLCFPNGCEPQMKPGCAGTGPSAWIKYIVQTSNKPAQKTDYRLRSWSQILHNVLLSMPIGLAIPNPLHSRLWWYFSPQRLIQIGTVGGCTAWELEEATSGCTGPDIGGLALFVMGSTVIEAAVASSIATPSTAAVVAGEAGNIHAQSASTSCVSCLPVMTTKLASTIQTRQSIPPCDSSMESEGSGSLATSSTPDAPMMHSSVRGIAECRHGWGDIVPVLQPHNRASLACWGLSSKDQRSADRDARLDAAIAATNHGVPHDAHPTPYKLCDRMFRSIPITWPTQHEPPQLSSW
jgi:hypothetical protein